MRSYPHVLYHWGWGNFDPHAKSKTKEARTINLHTIVVCHIVSITNQLNIPISRCSIVCRYCSIVGLITKMVNKMVEFSSSSQEDEIHMVDSPFNEDSKTINFFNGDPNFGGGITGKLGKMGKNMDIH